MTWFQLDPPDASAFESPHPCESWCQTLSGNTARKWPSITLRLMVIRIFLIGAEHC